MIEAAYTPTFRDLVAGTTLQLRMRTFRLPGRIFGFVLLALWLATLIQGQISTASFMYFLMPLVAIFMAFGHHIIAFISAIAARKLVDGKNFTFQFTVEHYRIQSPGTDATISWSNVMEVFDAKDGFLICPNKYIGVWIPSRAFQSSEDDFRALLKTAHIKTRKL